VVHHAGSGALDRRSLGAVETLTVAEYRALPGIKRFGYWLYRHPLVLFGLGPAYMFLLQHRVPIGMMRHGWRPWLSVQATNLGIAALAIGMMMIFGVLPFLLIYLPVTILAASAGVWLFFVQHQFEQTYWARGEEWNFHDAALLGSSHYDLPPILRWFTANIGIHHVHHLNSHIPYYRLPQVLRDEPGLRAVGRLTLLASIRCAGLALWDESSRRLISFRELRRMRRAQPA
jgi:omega-6 fatty acid desaturase (delta-12 desaturase)